MKIFSWVFLRLLFGACVCFLPSHSLASWKKFLIPNAVCGNGSEYSVFVRSGQREKVTFDLMGGGVCWDENTCSGVVTTSPNFALPFVPNFGGVSSSQENQSPFFDSTYVYFPYCTSDVHAGTHTFQFNFRKKFQMQGRLNFEKSVNYLLENNIVQLNEIDEFSIIGASAGAIGALIHAPYLERFVPAKAKKTIVADAPGLHFGEKFWGKFPEDFQTDVHNALLGLDVNLPLNEGNIAKFIPSICKRLQNWNVGFLQGSKDIAMSRFFGNISQRDHEKLVFSENGLWEATRNPNDNCSSWIKKSSQHTFTLAGMKMETVKGKTVYQFVSELLKYGAKESVW